MKSVPQSQSDDLFDHIFDGLVEDSKAEAENRIKAVPDETKRLYVYDRESQLKDKPNTFTLGQYNYCLKYWHNACCMCGNKDRLQLDHWIPVMSHAFPGTTIDNMLPLCEECNVAKLNYEPKQWTTKRFGKRKLKQIERYFALVKLRKI